MTKNTLPKYQRIERDIITSIRNGDLKPGDKVDSESVLKKKYGVSTITVRKAFSDLINDGYLVGVQGAGTFVAKKQMIQALTSISFNEELIRQGYSTSMKIDRIEYVINATAAEKLGVDKDEEILCISRIRYADDNPVAYHISYIKPGLLSEKEAEEVKKTKSLYETFNRHDIFPIMVNENYSVKAIGDAHICSCMNVKKGYNSFFVKRTTFDELNEIVEYAETYFNHDFYSVTVNIKA